MRKLLLLFPLALLAGACMRKESVPLPVHSGVLSSPPSTLIAAASPKPRPLADNAYRAEFSLARPAPASATAGTMIKFVIRIHNTGSGIFPSKPSAAGLRDVVSLSYHVLEAKDRTPVIFDGLRALLPADLPAGASVDLPIQVLMPGVSGSYLLVFDLVHEDITWFETRKNAVLSAVVKVA